MLLIQDVHVVIGRDEMPFDDAYRNDLAPRVAEHPGTRLAGFFWAPHGGGEGYEAITLTAVSDIAALERHQERLATGDLAELWSKLEGMQRHIDSSLQVLAEWSPLSDRDLESYSSGEFPTAMFRLDTFRTAGEIEHVLNAVKDQAATASPEAVVSLSGCWSPYLGELDCAEVTVLSRVASDEALRSAFSQPAEEWTGIPALPDARRMTRLLRSATWSPIH
jgi:hypothetical protein